MKYSQSFQHRQEQRLEQRLDEPTFMGYSESPHIEGLPIQEYRRISPKIKMSVEYLDRINFTDPPRSIKTLHNSRKTWEKSLAEAFNKPLSFTSINDSQGIPPIVISPEEGLYQGHDILDGNHRAYMAGFYMPHTFSINISNQEDLNALKILVDEGVLHWPHSFDYDAVMKKKEMHANYLSGSDYHDQACYLMDCDPFEGHDPFESQLELDDEEIKYHLSWIAHFTYPSGNFSDSLYPNKDILNVEESFRNDLWERSRNLADKSLAIKSNPGLSPEDAAQHVFYHFNYSKFIPNNGEERLDGEYH